MYAAGVLLAFEHAQWLKAFQKGGVDASASTCRAGLLLVTIGHALVLRRTRSGLQSGFWQHSELISCFVCTLALPCSHVRLSYGSALIAEVMPNG